MDAGYPNYMNVPPVTQIQQSAPNYPINPSFAVLLLYSRIINRAIRISKVFILVYKSRVKHQKMNQFM